MLIKKPVIPEGRPPKSGEVSPRSWRKGLSGIQRIKLTEFKSERLEYFRWIPPALGGTGMTN
jgi:hypothetical protein